MDCKGVHRIVHCGPSKTMEAYVQETGQAGRDGQQSIAYILYHGILLNHIEGQMKSFVKTSECRRQALMKHFDSALMQPEKAHLCCDNCSVGFKCGMTDCGTYAKYPAHQIEETSLCLVREREVPPEKKTIVEESLTKYHKSLVRQGDVKTLTSLQFMLGFTDHQISQVAENLKMLFTLSDIYQFVEIWGKGHAVKILSVINDVFKDVQEDNQSHCLPSDDNDDDCF